jgi:hypothetical protein
LSPGDAEPWLHLAAQALARGDADAASAALAHAAEANVIGARTGALLATAAAALPQGMPLLEQTAVLAALAELGTHHASAGLEVIDTACAAAELQGGTRRAQCDALATMLVERGQSSAAVTAGVQLGERLGWPAARTAAVLRAQRAALDASMRFVSSPQALACGSLRRTRELVLLTGRLGEIGAGHELLRREGSSKRFSQGRQKQ